MPVRPDHSDNLVRCDDGRAGRNQHLAAQDVESQAIGRSDERRDLPAQNRDFVGAVHSVNAEL
jgi:hypothetical protein